jgi:hypothetical protein
MIRRTMLSGKVLTRWRGQRLFELAGILAFGGAIATLVGRVVREADDAADWFWVTAGSVLGYLLADFMSGFVHWAGDTLGDENTPIMGKTFIGPFRDHHIDPKGITRHDFIETNGNNCIASLPFLALVWLFFPAPGSAGLFAITMVTSGALFTFGTNQFHKWAHADAAPRAVRALQRWGLILAPSHHGVHHTVPYDRYYCITVGWLNEPLRRLRFFEAMEWLVRVMKPDLLHRERKKLAALGLGPADEPEAPGAMPLPDDGPSSR